MGHQNSVFLMKIQYMNNANNLKYAFPNGMRIVDLVTLTSMRCKDETKETTVPKTVLPYVLLYNYSLTEATDHFS